MISDWKVRLDVESLSDHLYVEITLGRTGPGPIAKRPEFILRWNRQNWNLDMFTAVAEWEFGQLSANLNNENAETCAYKIKKILHKACDAAADRVRKDSRRRRTYWWNSTIAEARKQAISTRRKWMRSKIRNNDPEVTKNLRGICNDARRNLRCEINKAKMNSWQKLLDGLDSDPWGLPYRIVLNKLRSTGSALTESLDETGLERTLSTLFPVDANEKELQTSNHRRRMSLSRPEINEVVSRIEVEGAIKAKSGQNTAPGLDGITMRAIRSIPSMGLKILASTYTKCLNQGQFPEVWKRAALVLIPKETPVNMENPKVRPICLLSELGKILESIIVNRMWDWMDFHPIHPSIRRLVFLQVSMASVDLDLHATRY